MNSADLSHSRSPASPSTAGGVSFLDLRIHFWTDTERVLVGIAGFFAIVVSIALLRLFAFAWLAGLILPIILLGIVTCSLLGVWVRRRSVSRALRRIFDGPLPRNAGDAALFFGQLARALEATNYRRGLQIAAERLAASGAAGFAVRYYTVENPPSVEPITMNFEPCPPDQVHPTFRGIALRTEDLKDADERSELRRFLSRAWGLGVFSTGTILYFLFFIAPEAWQSRMITTNMILYLILVAAVIALQYRSTAPSNRALLVPAGLVDRGPRWLPTRRAPHLFRPAASVLFTYPMMGEKWGWNVADSARTLSGVGTELEIRTLLRAWLSPLPPPTPEMVRELAGE